ncbi:MAG: oxidoreductase [Acidiphilium sp. 37-64-53]|uniref:SDR family oxidoreductase n=1 Tax=Acidiphilium TaxID=522 RepID=UPI000BD96A23|nr:MULTISPECIES: SDR family oxidoreductase [Acidiphilium]OYW03943.1 MAG: oxidoreductase [Acidiphilium sp. 37-64-53]OZB27022.1 MAG: oxidoreductase [Acidiphilium sp. 34-64-41]HQT83879.1 SDR family oxidoreductase [Acidiphilium rubrum]
MDEARRVALVSGGGRGIGAAIAARLAVSGHAVIAADRDIAGLTAPDGVRLVACDVSDEAAVAALLDRVRAEHGRLDALVCNAGFMIRKPIGQLCLAEWRSVIDTHLTSIFLLVRAAEPLLRAAKGAVVTMASTRARMSEPDTESYAAAKGGIVALTHALAMSLGPDVRVNCISPGWIDTQGHALSARDHAQHPVGRVGTVDDIAALAAFLLGAESGFITGAEFVADGGMTRKMIYAE